MVNLSFIGSPTSPVLDQALKATSVLFEGDGVRENAKKVLLVFTDKNSGLDENKLRSAAVELENKEVEIITVSIGDESNSSELAYVTPHTGNIIDAPTDENPDKLSTEILNLIITGWLYMLLCDLIVSTLDSGSSSSDSSPGRGH